MKSLNIALAATVLGIVGSHADDQHRICVSVSDQLHPGPGSHADQVGCPRAGSQILVAESEKQSGPGLGPCGRSPNTNATNAIKAGQRWVCKARAKACLYVVQ